ncbi:MAG TPA: reverse transcriptase family protein [Acidimicrobiales bacterium]|nr:reverse transcriptase family protein [Acidimicrobiales bacterium]
MADRSATVARALADALLAGPWELAAMTRRAQRAVGERRVWLRDLAHVSGRAYPSPPLDRPRELAALVAACRPLVDRFEERRPPPAVRHWFLAPTAMGERRWPVVPLDTVRDLRDLLGLTLPDLRWLADVRGLERGAPEGPLRHYRYRWVPKGDGSGRLIEAPKQTLKHIQRVLLREILDRVPPDAHAHGFHPGRSALTFAAAHAGRPLVVRLDLEDFFSSVPAGRAFGVYRRCGYPEPVAHLLTGLTTNAVPSTVLAGAPRPLAAGDLDRWRRQARRLAAPHLPQGAPTSPAVANLAALRLDRRLAGLAGAAGLTYGRYADDLALSSPHRLPAGQVARLLDAAAGIAAEEGFRLNASKTTVRHAGQRQRLVGLVVNERPTIGRHEYDRLRAILHNAARHGPAGQNRAGHADFRAHLRGRVVWVEHVDPRRGARLRATFEQIDWGG